MKKTPRNLPIDVRVRLRLELETSKRLIAFLDFLNRFVFKNSIEIAERGFRIRSTFFVTHNAGLFAIASGVIWDLSNMSGSVKKVNSSFGCGLYKNRPFQNVWPLLFSQPKKPLKVSFRDQSSPSFVEFWKYDYSTLPLRALNLEAQKFTAPSRSVLAIGESLEKEYGLNLTNLIGVHYRGTDKYLEIPVSEISNWEAAIENARHGLIKPRILVLSDDFGILNHFKAKFDGSFSIDKLTSGSGDIGAHFTKKANPLQEAQIFLALVYIVSKSSKLITHTGNGALWEVIYRGHTEGVTQLRGSMQ